MGATINTESHALIQKVFFRGDPTFLRFFFFVFFFCFFFFFFFFFFLFCCFVFVRGERIKNHYKWAIIGSPAKRHLNGVSLAGRWWRYTEC